MGGSAKQKPDLGEISRTGKPYLFKFFSENLCLPGQILLGHFLETGVCHSPCLSPRCRTADGGNSPALEGQSRLTKGQALWEETPGLPSPPDRLLGSSFLMQTVWCQGQVHLQDLRDESKDCLPFGTPHCSGPPQHLLSPNCPVFYSEISPFISASSTLCRTPGKKCMRENIIRSRAWWLTCVNPTPGRQKAGGTER